MPVNNSGNNMPDTKIGRLKPPLLVTIFSGKGGTGKSVLAYNMADILCREGHKCLLIDAARQSGNLHIMANSRPAYSLDDIIIGAIGVDDAIVRLREGLDFIASPACTGRIGQFSPASWARFLGSARDNLAAYDIVVFDTPSSDLNIISLATAASDINLMIFTPELTSIANNYGLYKFLINENKNADINILFNNVKTGRDSEYIYQKFSVLSKRFLGIVPFNAGYLPEDKTVAEALGRQKPLVEVNSESAAAVQILRLCEFLTIEKTRGGHLQKIKETSSINFQTALADIKDDI